MFVSSAVVVSVCLGVGLREDPSLYRALEVHAAPFATVADGLAPLVLDHGGVEILWDGFEERFHVAVSGTVISDLVTGTNGAGYPSFEGKFTTGGEPTVHGYVIPGADSSEYTVVLTVPNNKPRSLDVHNSTGVSPWVDASRECGCTDGEALDCTISLCNVEESCPSSAVGVCEWGDTGT